MLLRLAHVESRIHAAVRPFIRFYDDLEFTTNIRNVNSCVRKIMNEEYLKNIRDILTLRVYYENLLHSFNKYKLNYPLHSIYKNYYNENNSDKSYDGGNTYVTISTYTSTERNSPREFPADFPERRLPR
jgi:hypothetical protein